MITLIKLFFFSCLFLLVTALTHAQVGIGTSDVNASARLQVDATNKGFLPPRVALQGTNDAQLTNQSSPRITSPATGLLVYNTATAGSGATAVTPGFYYYDGAKWQRIINQQPDATVTFDGANPNSGTNFSGTTQSRDFIYVSNTDNSQWTWNGSVYVTYVPPPSTPWMLSGGTSDAGSNKSGAIYRTGSVGIGSNTIPNASAQLDVNSTTKGFLPPRMNTAQRSAISGLAAGLIVYNTSISQLEYYNGTSWTALVAGNAPMYAQFKANALQGSFVIDVTKVDFPTVVINQGGITTSANNTFTLPANRIYRIDLNLGYKNGGWCRFGIYDNSTGTILSETAHLESSSYTGTGIITHFINTSNGSKVIDIRMKAGGCTLNDPNNGGTYATLTILAVD